MILQGLSPELLARLLNLDRPGDTDSWLLFGPEQPGPEDAEAELNGPRNRPAGGPRPQPAEAVEAMKPPPSTRVGAAAS